ncbi:MAG: DNA mismatch repair protein MutS [Methanospirillum sp.]|nr:DNA mismatch repair protein MutS [Methanospirillum sp.]
MSDGLSPGMRQYLAAKREHPDALLLCRMGDFYETFGPDAETVARELDIVLTSRGTDRDGNRIPLAGVPFHAAESYINRLVRKGYRVAIAEQMEDPKRAKGLVRREVVRVVTPGTLVDGAMLDAPQARYLMAVAPGTGETGIAALDASTGEFSAFTVSNAEAGSALIAEMARRAPEEVLVPEGLDGPLLKAVASEGGLVTRRPTGEFDASEAVRRLGERFGRTFEADGAVAAAGAALAYAEAMNNAPLPQVAGLSLAEPTGTEPVLDAITIRNLELTRPIRDDRKGGTLLGVIDRTVTPMGSRTLRARIVRPLAESGAINRRLDAVGFFASKTAARMDLRRRLNGVGDLERITARIAYGNCSPRDLAALRRSLEAHPGIVELLTSAGELPELVEAAADGLGDHAETADLLARALVDEPPALARSGGMLRAGFDPELDRLRELAASGRDWIAGLQQTERERTGLKSLKIGYNRVFGYYVEVSKSQADRVPPEYERRQTTASAERFTLPGLREKETEIAHADERLAEREQEVWEEVIDALRPAVPGLQAAARALGLLDLFAGLAEVAVCANYTRPTVDDGTAILIRGGRHPVVEQQTTEPFVPNDTVLDTGSEQLLIITGANMAGKSTYMRAVALITVMAQCGFFVPADHATVGVVDRVFTRVGAFDDLASGQSTFMVEMLELANILVHATPRSLVVLDEIGRGTSTLDGYAIARAVLEFLHGKGKAGPRTLFATHFHELVEAENDLARVRNFHMAVKDTGTSVIFTRSIIPGATDRSYGVHVAELAGVPARVIERARVLLEDLVRREAAREPGTGPRRVRYTQMLLPVENDANRPPEPPILVTLRALDPDRMTPLEALQALYRLKEEAGE